jgi:PAS domain S-box-containing protein
MIKESTKIAIGYLILGSIWILVSDRIAHSIPVDSQYYFQTYKGIGFIIVTALLLWYLIHRYEKKQEQSYAQLSKLNRAYTVANRLNELIAKTDNKQTLFEQVCQILVKEGHYIMAWIGEIDDIRNTINVAASAGNTEDYLAQLNINLYDNISGGGPTGTCIKTGKPVIANDIETDPRMLPWRNKALKYGYKSSAGFPLKVGGLVIGNINIYSADKNFFHPEEEKLLGNVINNISQALDYMKLEADKAAASIALAESEERLRLSLRSGKQGLYDLNVQTGEAIVNEEYAQMLGYNPATFIETNAFWQSRLHPDDRERCAKMYTDYINGMEAEYKVEFRQRTADGRWKWILSTGKLVMHDAAGNPLRMLGTHTDIDEIKGVENALKERIKEMTCISAVRLEMTKDQPIAIFCKKVLTYLVEGMQFPKAALPVITFYEERYEFQQANYATLKCIEAPITIQGVDSGNLNMYYADRNLPFIEPEEQELINNVAVSIGMFITNTLTKNKLKESLRILEEAQKVASIGHYVYHVATKRWECSTVIDDMLGIDADFEKDFDHWLHQLVAPRFRDSIENSLDTLLNNTEIFTLDFGIIHQKNQQQIWVTVTGRFERGEDGTPLQLVGTVQDITETKRNQELLEKSNNQLNATLSAIPDLLFEVDIDGTYLDVHATRDELLYTAKDGLIGKNIFALLPADAAAIGMKAIAEANEKGFSTGQQILLPVPAGLSWFELSIAKKNVSDTEKPSFIVLSRDITERKKAEQELLRNQSLLLEAQKFAKIGNYENYIEAGIWEGSNQLYELMGLDYSKTKNHQDWFDLIVPEQKEEVIAHFKHCIDTRQIFDKVYKIINPKTTQLIWLRGIGKLDFNEEDKPYKMIGTVQDVTSQMEEEIRLRLYESVITNATDGVAVTEVDPNNPHGSKIIYINRSYERMTGYTLKEVKGKNPRILQGPLTQRDPLDKMKLAIEMGEPYEIEVINYRKNKAPFWSSVSISPLKDVKGNITHWIGIKRDISKRKEQEQEREQLIRELTLHNKDLRQFSFITSHNMKAPLSNLQGLLNMIKEIDIQDNALKEIIEDFKVSTQQLNDTINDLVKILIIKENTSVEQEVINIATTISKVYEKLTGLADDYKHKPNITMILDEAQSIFFNRSYFEGIILQLMSNAIVFQSPDRQLQINITAYKSKNGIALSIKDNGIGLNTERYKDRLFGLYQRFHSISTSKGLGLYLVKSQMEALGGSVEIISNENEGTELLLHFKDKTN